MGAQCAAFCRSRKAGGLGLADCTSHKRAARRSDVRNGGREQEEADEPAASSSTSADSWAPAGRPLTGNVLSKLAVALSTLQVCRGETGSSARRGRALTNAKMPSEARTSMRAHTHTDSFCCSSKSWKLRAASKWRSICTSSCFFFNNVTGV